MAASDPDTAGGNGATDPAADPAGRRAGPICEGPVGREPERAAGLPVAGAAAARRPVQHRVNKVADEVTRSC
jgi:hypothetical protein